MSAKRPPTLGRTTSFSNDGGSAIAAVASVTRPRAHETSIALAVVFLLNGLALVIFPPLGHAAGLSQESFGRWAALAVHDTSSVVGAAASYVAAESIAAAFDEVTRQRATFAVVPFETRADGPVQATILKLTASDLKIVACFEVVQNLQLVCRTGNAADVEKIYATAADRAACEHFLAREMPRASVLDVKSPLLACQLAQEDHGAGAIAGEEVAVGLNPIRARLSSIHRRSRP